ncbi:porin [Thalassotalea fonticola]|uniref:Porin n=1 Tax=Thalassotalea fonticola TaxID=3065649 RepID=A0ABZ0GL20_9GAMM|nr:porin [Colwelliaceae bacterium S1-1]
MKLSTSIALVATMLTPTLAQANSELFNWYGSIRVQLQDTKDGEVEYKDNYSRIGAYGSTEILDGIKATYNFEFRLFTDDGSFAGDDDRARLANVGLEGDFGSFLIGKQYSPHWNFTDNAIDIFSDIDQSAGCTNESAGVICHTHRYGLWAVDAAGNGHYIEYLRPDRAITYMTPNMAGFQAAIMAVTNNGDVKSNAAGTESESIVGYNFAAKYTIADITVSASRYDLTGMVGDNKVDAVQVAYNHEQLSLAARYQDSSDMRFYEGLNPSGEIVEEEIYEVYAGYKINEWQIQATYADVSMDSPSGLTVDTSQVILDVIYHHKAGTFYAEYSAWGDEAEQVYEATDTILVGYRLDF